MQTITTSQITSLLLTLCAFQATAATLDNPQAGSQSLFARQDPVSCQEYATLANLSTIGTNSTFRAAFIQADPVGTLQSSAVLDDATAKFTQLALINDTALNQECGNLTQVAMQAAPQNFSQGIVGPFTIGEGGRLGNGIGFTAMLTASMVGTAMLLL